MSSPFFTLLVSSSDEIVANESGDYPVFIEVTEIEMSSGFTVEVIIYYPGYVSRIDKQNRNNDGPFPLIIFSPGAGGGVLQYTTLVSDLASYGFIVAGVSWTYESNREDDVAHIDHTLVIDTLEEMSSSFNSPLFRLVDTENCGAYGHSRGGRSAYLASWIDSRIKAISAWMPTLNNASNIDQSTKKLLFAGIFDDVANPHYWTDPLYESCDPLIAYVITNGDHTPNEEIHGDITFKFFRLHLKDDALMETEVYGQAIKNRAESGEFQLKIKSAEGEYNSAEIEEAPEEEPEKEPVEEPEEEPVEETGNEENENGEEIEDPDADPEEENDNPEAYDEEEEYTQADNISEDTNSSQIPIMILGSILIIIGIIVFVTVRNKILFLPLELLAKMIRGDDE